jgi:hypothetical protein
MSGEVAIFAQHASGVVQSVAKLTAIGGVTREMRYQYLAEVRQAANAALLVRLNEYHTAMARRNVEAIIEITRSINDSGISGEGYDIAMGQLRTLGRLLSENLNRLQNGNGMRW